MDIIIPKINLLQKAEIQRFFMLLTHNQGASSQPITDDEGSVSQLAACVVTTSTELKNQDCATTYIK